MTSSLLPRVCRRRREAPLIRRWTHFVRVQRGRTSRASHQLKRTLGSILALSNPLTSFPRLPVLSLCLGTANLHRPQDVIRVKIRQRVTTRRGRRGCEPGLVRNLSVAIHVRERPNHCVWAEVAVAAPGHDTGGPAVIRPGRQGAR